MSVDTVFGGCYRREAIVRLGGFDESLVRNSDLEFNQRLRRSGGRILLFPDIVSFYSPSADLRQFAWKNFADGASITLPLSEGKRTFSYRHLVPLAFVTCVMAGGAAAAPWSPARPLFLAGLGAYVAASAAASLSRERSPAMAAVRPLVFVLRHLPYGLGSMAGLIRAASTSVRRRVRPRQAAGASPGAGPGYSRSRGDGR
jgi:hypothetical protein